MEAEQVIDKIMADARAEAEKIRKQAAESQAAEQSKQDEELARYRQETAAMAGKAAEDERSHLLAAARMAAAMEYLAEKAGILNAVFAQVRQRVGELPEDEYRALMTKLMLRPVTNKSSQERMIPASIISWSTKPIRD
jgi:vacuolar-type H+-ATPase subunit E/Vma4